MPVPLGPARVSFEHVTFRYPIAAEVSLASLESIAVPDKMPEKIVLHDVSFTVGPGEMLALVGPSGAGKTTITQLVPRLYDVQSGRVTVNGQDVRDASLDSLRARMGVVTQDAHLFHDTIRANLLYARPEADEAMLENALRAAEIWPLVSSLPQGLDTLVGERGYRFSGGENSASPSRGCCLRLLTSSSSMKQPLIWIPNPKPPSRRGLKLRWPAVHPSSSPIACPLS
jgi:ATP-binding cassette subfamily B protein